MSAHTPHSLPQRFPGAALTRAERRALERLAQQTAGPHREARRAQLVLLAAEGLSDGEICSRVGYSEATVRIWRRRFARGRVPALRNKPWSVFPRI